MERLLTSLHDLLDPETDSPPPPNAPKPYFPLSLKCSILHNAASGLAFLHGQSPPIIHRDLSARNVLLSSGMVAKIADLGVARTVPRMRVAATMTKAPGAGIYMPPEALEAKSEEEEQRSKYDASIDIFSFGVVSIFTLSQTFPCNLLAHNYRVGRRHIARTELERRAQYMQMIYRQLRKNHPLLQMIERCLDFPEDRPSIGEVLGLLEQARGEERDQQMEMNKLELVRALQAETMIQSSMAHIELQQQLQSSTQQLMRKEAELTRAEETIRREQQQIQEMKEREQQLVQAKDRELAQTQQQLRYQEQSSRKEIDELVGQLQSSESLVAIFQKTLQQRDSELETLRAKTRGSEPPPPQTRNLSTSYAFQPKQQPYTFGLPVIADPQPTPQRKLTVRCRDKKRAPYVMKRGSATRDHEFAYFVSCDSRSVYRYKWNTGELDELPPCPYCDSALVIIDGALTAVGGCDGYRDTNELWTLRRNHWAKELPPMKNARSQTAVVSTREYVLVVGGNRWAYSTVELFQVWRKKWCELTALPQHFTLPTATICGNHIHVIGCDGNGFSCAVQDLPSSDQPITSQSRSRTISWSPLPPLPVTNSTAATIGGQLVIIGGIRNGSGMDSILQLVDGQWVVIGFMSSNRCMCLVVSQSPDKMMIVGGWRGIELPTDTVEECVVVQ